MRNGCAVQGCTRPVKAKGLCICHYISQRRSEKRGGALDPRHILGITGQRLVGKLLRDFGRNVEDQGPRAPFDLLVDGYRIEVKTGRIKPGGFWFLNVQSNGILDERSDFYVFRLEGSGEPIHLLLKSPLGVRGVKVSERSLSTRFSSAILDFQAFAKGEYRQKAA